MLLTGEGEAGCRQAGSERSAKGGVGRRWVRESYRATTSRSSRAPAPAPVQTGKRHGRRWEFGVWTFLPEMDDILRGLQDAYNVRCPSTARCPSPAWRLSLHTTPRLLATGLVLTIFGCGGNDAPIAGAPTVTITAQCASGPRTVTPYVLDVPSGSAIQWMLDSASDAKDFNIRATKATEWPFKGDNAFHSSGKRAVAKKGAMDAAASGIYHYSVDLTCPNGQGKDTTIVIDPIIVVHKADSTAKAASQ